MSQIELHSRIDAILNAGFRSANIKEIQKLITNDDIRRYFYAQVGSAWLPFLKKHGFFEILKEEKIDDKPEAFFLQQKAKEAPKEVLKIILDTPLNSKTDPNILNQFLYAFREMPIEMGKKMIPKIVSENWVKLMEKWQTGGYGYNVMLKRLLDGNAWKEIEEIVPMLFQIKKFETTKFLKAKLLEASFYFSTEDLSEFGATLTKIPSPHGQKIANYFIESLAEIIEKTATEKPKKSIFDFYDNIYLPSSEGSIEGLAVGRGHYSTSREIFLTIIRDLLKKYFQEISESDPENLHEKALPIFQSFPNTTIFLQLKIFFYSKFPDFFQREIVETLFRIFEVENFWDLGSLEYEKLLMQEFRKLPPEKQGEFFELILQTKWPTREESRIRNKDYKKWLLQRIIAYLSLEQIKGAKKLIGEEIKPAEPVDFSPKSRYARMIAGPKTAKYSVETLMAKSPEEIIKIIYTEKFNPETEDDFTLGGMRDVLKEVVKKRAEELSRYSEKFFSRDKLEPDYTYAFLSGIMEALKENDALKPSWGEILKLMNSIAHSDKTTPLPLDKKRKESFYDHLYGWGDTLRTLVDLLDRVLHQDFEKIDFNFEEHHSQCWTVISHFLQHPNPKPEDEEVFSKKTPPEEEKKGRDPLHIAINSIRGMAFINLLTFLYRDGILRKNENSKISDSVKKALEDHLDSAKEKTMAIRFLYGHHLATIYYRDPTWTKSLLPKIFDTSNEKMFFAAWEGYLAQNVYFEIFQEMKDVYKYVIPLGKKDYTNRPYVCDLDKGLATHLAIAFIYGFIELDSDLIQKFFSTKNTIRHAEFTDFVGRHCVSRENFDPEKEGIKKERLVKYWEWRLADKRASSEELKEFGWWVNKEKKEGEGFFPTKWWSTQALKTLQRTKGLWEWDFGILENISVWAKEEPENTIEILDLLMRWKEEGSDRFWHINNDFVPTLKILYTNPKTSKKAYELIDFLVENGHWEVKEALK